MFSNNRAFRPNFGCTSAIRYIYLLAVQFLCKHFIVTWLQCENTDRERKIKPGMRGVEAHETSVS